MGVSVWERAVYLVRAEEGTDETNGTHTTYGP
jgi:hypothetical protein